MTPLNVLILAAGHGKRMKSQIPKPLHKIGGREILYHIVALAEKLSAQRMAVVVSPTFPQINQPHLSLYVQATAQGTGHAVMAAQEWIQASQGDILILCGDVPFIQAATLKTLIDKKARKGADLAILAAHIDTENSYGRLFLDAADSVEKIIEAKELKTTEEKNASLCNSGIILVSAKHLPALLSQLDNKNESQEYYLTDIIDHARKSGLQTTYSLADKEEIQGINSQADLAKAEQIFQQSLREQALENGVKLIAPETVFFSFDTELEADTVLEPNIIFGPGVKVSKGCTIKAFSYLEGCTLAENVQIGPFARIRPDSRIDKDARVGNFVEIKNTHLHQGSKVNHLSYCGDSSIGKHSNLGAGTITCNYNGAIKSKTQIGDNCFIGSNTSLIAPLNIGDNVVVAAGSTLTQNVASGELAVARTPQKNLPNKGETYLKTLKNQKG